MECHQPGKDASPLAANPSPCPSPVGCSVRPCASAGARNVRAGIGFSCPWCQLRHKGDPTKSTTGSTEARQLPPAKPGPLDLPGSPSRHVPLPGQEGIGSTWCSGRGRTVAIHVPPSQGRQACLPPGTLLSVSCGLSALPYSRMQCTHAGLWQWRRCRLPSTHGRGQPLPVYVHALIPKYTYHCRRCPSSTACV